MLVLMRGSRNKFQGEGVQAWRPDNSLDHFFFSPQLVLQLTEGVQWFYYRENILFQGSRVGPTFSGGGVQLFRGGRSPIANFYGNSYHL